MVELRHRQWHFGIWIVWGLLALICATYGLFALAVGLHVVASEKVRALPLAFEIHALAGGTALLTGSTQFNAALRTRMVRAHRWAGRLYVIGALLASATAVADAAFFDVGWAARLSFVLLGTTWFLVTSVAFAMIRKRRVARHREWMARSFSLTLFFVTFSFWVPVLAGQGAEHDATYFVAVTLSWVVNLLGAELWIQRTSPQ